MDVLELKTHAHTPGRAHVNRSIEKNFQVAIVY